QQHEDFAERFVAFMRERTACLIELAAKGEHACELMHCTAEEMRTEVVRKAHARFKVEELEILRELIDDAKRAKEIEVGESHKAAALIQRAYASLSPPWIFSVPKDQAMKLAWDLAQLLLHGLLRRPHERRR